MKRNYEDKAYFLNGQRIRIDTRFAESVNDIMDKKTEAVTAQNDLDLDAETLKKEEKKVVWQLALCFVAATFLVINVDRITANLWNSAVISGCTLSIAYLISILLKYNGQ